MLENKVNKQDLIDLLKSDVEKFNKYRKDTDYEIIDLRNAELYDADLRNANLYDADLRYANLRCADLYDADLRYANLRYADLYDADLSNADLRNANLSHADLRNADLCGADLCGANLYDADLRNADLRNADLRNANIDYSSGLSLWCGSFNIQVDIEQVKQLLYHICRLQCEDEQFKQFIDRERDFANQSSVIKRHGLDEIE